MRCMNQYLSVLVAFSFTLATTAFAEEPCTILEQYEVSNMQPVRSQDGVSFCYAFASVALVQQLYCKNKKGGCVYSFDPKTKTSADDRLSVVDALALVSEGRLVEGGAETLTLHAIKNKGSLALEKCAPFDGLIQSDHKFASLGVKSNWWQRLRDLFKQYRSYDTLAMAAPAEQKFARACAIAEKVKETANLKTDVDQIATALKRDEFQKFAKEAILPNQCEESRVPLPSFSVKTLGSADPASAGPKIASLLKNDTPVNVSICTAGPHPKCGGHAIVLSGIRHKCCGSSCSRQYRIHDSANVFWSKADRDNYSEPWVDAGIVLKKVEQFGGDPVRWLEF